MVTVVKTEHIEEELDKNKYKFDSLEECTDADIIFTIFCETVISLNESYTVDNLAREYTESKYSIDSFTEQKFKQVTTPDLRSVLGKANKNLYIKYTKEGIAEYLGSSAGDI